MADVWGVPVIHVEPIVLMCRKFSGNDKWGDEYKAVLTVQKIDNVGYCAGCHGEFTVTDFRDLQRKLKTYGIKKLKWDRGNVS